MDRRRSDADALERLVRLGQRLRGKPVLLPATDSWVIAVSRNRDLLAPWFVFPAPRRPFHELVDKRTMHDIVTRHGLPAPRTYVPADMADLRRIAGSLAYPCIVKPAYSVSWRTPEMERLVAHHKALEVRSAEELERTYAALAAVDDRLLVQELVPGDDTRMHEVSAYCGADSRLLGAFVGRKLFLCPPELGSASLVESVSEPELVERLAAFLEDIGYRGLCNVEFKKDARDERFKLIELNARYGLWDGLGIRCGVDLPWIAYRDLIGAPPPPRPGAYRTGIKWLHLEKHLEVLVRGRREGRLSTRAWLSSLRGEKEHATFAWDDPAPILSWLWTSGKRAPRYLARGRMR